MPSIRRQINIAAPPSAIWRALTTPEGWKSWYADEARIDGRAGGRVVLRTEDDDGNPVEEVGIIHTWRPTSRLEIAWDTAGKAPTRGTRVTFNVARDGEETRLSLVHAGAGVLDDPAGMKSLDDNWRRAFASLREALEQG